MSSRIVARVVVVAAISLFILAAPTKDQTAATCPADHEVNIEFWRMPVCVGSNPPMCETVEPELLGTALQFCDYHIECMTGDCNSPQTNSIVYEEGHKCELCGDQEP